MNMLKEKPFFTKLLLPWFTALAVLAAFFGFIGTTSVYAAEAQTVKLRVNGDQAEIILDFPEAAKEEIASLQLSLSVYLSSENAEAEYVPGEGLAAKIAEGRYNSESGILNIYVSGTSPLFDRENPVLTLGYVKVRGSGCYADIKIVKNSLKFVRGTELVEQNIGVEYSEETVRISAGGGNSSTGNTGGGGFYVPTSTSAEEPVPSETTKETEPVQTSSATSAATTTPDVTKPVGDITDLTTPDVNTPALPVEGESFSAAHTERLSEAVERAERFKRSDYTGDSYQTLSEALKRAKALLSDRESSQEQVDEALLILENAIGMLVHTSSPSGVDVITDAETDHIVSEESSEMTSDVSLETTTPAPNAEITTTAPVNPENTDITTQGGQNTTESLPEQSGEASADISEASGNSSGDLTVWIIVLAVLGVVVVVIAVAAAVSANKKKKKSSKGSHSNGKASKAQKRNGDDYDE